MTKHTPRGEATPNALPPRTLALLPGGDRFEDFFDKIGVSLETFRDEFTGGWLFNYMRALKRENVRTVLIFASARVDAAVHFTHVGSGATVWVLPSPTLHRKARNAQRRHYPDSQALVAATSYCAWPLRRLARVLREERCDAVLCQEYEDPRFDACVMLGRLLGIPVFATYQGANQTRTRFERTARRFSVRGSAGLIIPSLTEAARVQEVYRLPSQRIGLIANPVETNADEPFERNAVRAAMGISASARVVAWHGRVQIHTKGLDVLLDAWDRVCAERPNTDFVLLLIGTGRNADVLRHRIGESQRVIWIDRYVFKRQELWSYLSAADAYTIPSRREGFAVAVLEAMACGLPVVASDASGVAEVFPNGEADGGIIVPSEEHLALAHALLRLLEQPDLSSRLGRIARSRMDAEFSLDVIGPQLRQFLFPRSPHTTPG